MRTYGHVNYDTYVQAQYVETANKMQELDLADGDGGWVTEAEGKWLSDYLRADMPKLRRGLCHGVRNGHEVTLFRKHLGVDVIGTEIYPKAIILPNIVHWDFHEVKPEWFHAFDFVYSNSLDHAHAPEFCIRQWMSCIRLGGVCIIQWTPKHDKPVTAADCFSASEEEYLAMFAERYAVEVLDNANVGHHNARWFVLRHHKGGTP